MPTVRSQYSFSQFHERLRKKAHEIAKDLVTNLDKKATIVKSSDGIDIKNGDIEIRFYASHISFTERGEPVKEPSQYGYRECPKCGLGWQRGIKCENCGEETQPEMFTTYPNSFSIDVEAKNYTTSNHQTKISYIEGQKERAEQFISELMKGVEIVPRFSLANMTKKRIKRRGENRSRREDESSRNSHAGEVLQNA